MRRMKYFGIFEIQIDHLISARRPEQVITKNNTKENLLYCEVPLHHKWKIKENEKSDRFFDLARKPKKLWKMRVSVVPIMIDALGMHSKRLVRGTVSVRKRRKNRDHPNYSVVVIGKNTERSPG